MPLQIFNPNLWKSNLGQKYAALSNEPDVIFGVVDEKTTYCRSPVLCVPARCRTFILALSVVVLFSSITANVIVKRGGGVTDSACDRILHPYTPLAEAIEYEWVKFVDLSASSAYKGPPSDALEKSWADLWDYGAFNVPSEKLPNLNKSSSSGDFRRVDPQHGGGVAALLEGFHQIHCLDLIRQYIYRDQWDYTQMPSFGGDRETRRDYVDRCIETVRMTLMCQGDVTPFFVEIDKVQPHKLRPTFNGRHKCRKYNKLIEWVKDHVVFSTDAEY